MDIVAFSNEKQLDEVDVTIKVTMKLGEWKMISDSLRKESKDNYNWTKVDFALAVEKIFDEYHTVLLRKENPK